MLNHLGWSSANEAVLPAKGHAGPTPSRRFDVLYVEGPGDIVASLRRWKATGDTRTGLSIAYSGQLFEFASRVGASVLAVSYCPREDHDDAGDIVAMNLPRPQLSWPKIGYFLSSTFYAWRLLKLCIRHRVQLVFVDSGVSEWLPLALLKLAGAKVVPVLHNTLWPEGFPPQDRSSRFRQRLDRLFWRHAADLALAISPAAARQVRELAGPNRLPIVEYRPSFFVQRFPGDVAGPKAVGPLRVLFSGRLEEDKGATDFLAMAEQLLSAQPGDFEFDVCGYGRAEEAVRAFANDARWAGKLRFHGAVDGPQLVQRYAASHVVVVPTRSDFAEGFAKVVCEAILLHRPVVTSPVVPASEVYEGAVLCARTDDVESYVNVLRELQQSPQAYAAAVDACKRWRPTIAANDWSCGAALEVAHRRLVLKVPAAEVTLA